MRLLCTAVAVSVLASPARAQTPLSAGVAAATFDSVWTRINRTFYDTAFLNTRWVALRDSVRPLAAAAQSNEELRTTLQGMLGAIGVSHFGLIAREASPEMSAEEAVASANPGSIGLQVRAIGDRIVAWRVDSGGPAWQAGVRPGVSITRIGSMPVADAMERVARIESASVRRQTLMSVVMQANTRINRAPGDSIELGFGDDARWITAVPARGSVQKFGNLPPMNTTVDAYERREGGRCIGVIAFSVWMPVAVARIDSAVDRMRGCDALVFDVRGNPGGVAGMVGGVAGHVLDSAFTLGSLIQRTATLSLRANPRRVTSDGRRVEPFAGPVAVLIDPLSASASEFFAAALQGLGRARVFGETSAGASVPALMERLPNGDVLMHVIADHTDSKGRRVEGVGVIPDEVIPLNAASLAAGRDDALDAALRWAATQPGRTPTPR